MSIMSDIQSLTVDQLCQILSIKQQIENLQSQLETIIGIGVIPASFTVKRRKRHRMSAAGRAKIAAAQRARWAKVKGKTKPLRRPNKKDRRSSPAFRAKPAALARARWKKAKAAGKMSL
jgi:hypothetical protein